MVPPFRLSQKTPNADYIKLIARGYAARQFSGHLKNMDLISIDNLVPKVIHRIEPLAINYGAIINYIPKPPIKTKPKIVADPEPIKKPETLPNKSIRK